MERKWHEEGRKDLKVQNESKGEKNPGSVHVGFVVDKVELGQVFSPSTSVFPLIGQIKKTDHLSLHLHHRVAQYALGLRCVRSICCGALLQKIKK
jgi:hypothetical protein